MLLCADVCRFVLFCVVRCSWFVVWCVWCLLFVVCQGMRVAYCVLLSVVLCVVRCVLFVVCCLRFVVVCCCLLAIGCCSLAVSCCLLFEVSCRLRAMCWLTVCRLLSVVCYLIYAA